MKIYNIHAGHGLPNGIGCGAIGILDESAETRKVKNELLRLLKESGNTVYDCTYEGNASQNAILKSIVEKCNQHQVDLDISIHLNSGRNDYVGDNSTGGVEVYGYNTDVKEIGDKICSNISEALGIRNRGFKTTKNLYVLNNTKAKAILIECCFVDDKDDADHWNAEKCANAITKSLGYNPNSYTDSTQNNIKKYSVGMAVKVSSFYNSYNDTINQAIIKNAQGIISKIQPDSKNPYYIEGVGWCNNGDIRGDITKDIILQSYKHKKGDRVLVSSHYKNYNDDISKAVILPKWLEMNIVDIVVGAKNPYKTNFDSYINDGDIRNE